MDDNNNRYIFDKRVMKRGLIKYGIMFFAFFVLLIVINVLIFQPLHISSTAVVALDVVIALALWLACEAVLSKIAERRRAKQEMIEKVKKAATSTKSDEYFDEVIVEDVEVKKKDKK